MAQAEGVDSLVKGNPAHVRWDWLKEARMPSGTFKTNALVLGLGMLACNVLRLLGIHGKGIIHHRRPAKRRRLKTIIQERIQIPARILRGSGQLKLDIGRALPDREAFLALYRSLAAPFPSTA
ncbi:MAG: hypothetical protein ABSH53_24875 [Holophaga sp.]|jgi:hypothetical protein